MKLSSLPKNQSLDAVLAHYGVKGMRWGVRRTDAQLERAAAKRSTKANEGASKAEKKASKKSKVATAAKAAGRDKKNSKTEKAASKLSDDQLRQRINRLQMEKQYSQLTTKPSLLKKGSSFVAKSLANAAQQSLTEGLKKNVTDQVVGKGFETLLAQTKKAGK